MLANLVADVAIAADKTKIRKERGGGDQDAAEEDPAAAPIREAAHLAEANGNEKCRERGENCQRREGVALDRSRARDEPPRPSGG